MFFFFFFQIKNKINCSKANKNNCMGGALMIHAVNKIRLEGKGQMLGFLS